MPSVSTTIGILKLAPPKLDIVAYGKFPTIGAWMFVIDDDHPDGPLVSGTNGKEELYVGRLANPLDAEKWSDWAGTATLLATDAKDSWHVYAHGLHWISYSKPGNTDLNLFVLDRDLNVLLGGVIEVVKPGGGLYPTPAGVVTNDHFLATIHGTRASPGGKVSIAITDPRAPPSTTILVVSKAGLLVSSSTLAPAICNGSSGDQGFQASTLAGTVVNRVYAASSLSPKVASTVTLYEFDRSWSPVATSSTVLLSDPTINYAMATEVTLGGAGQRLVTYRKIDNELTGADGDRGKIARRWFGAFTEGLEEEELVLSNTANRPHTSVISLEGKSYLCTCWSEKDAESNGFDQVLRVEEIDD